MGEGVVGCGQFAMYETDDRARRRSVLRVLRHLDRRIVADVQDVNGGEEQDLNVPSRNSRLAASNGSSPGDKWPLGKTNLGCGGIVGR